MPSTTTHALDRARENEIARFGTTPIRRAQFRTNVVAADVMSKDLVSATPQTTAVEAFHLMADRRKPVTHLPVVMHGQLKGILCSCDLWTAPAHAPVSSFMTRIVTSVPAGESIHETAWLMGERNVGCLPVIEEGHLIGIITRGDMRRLGMSYGNMNRKCSSCGTQHHVRALARTDINFCLDCYRYPGMAGWEEDWEDLGSGG